MSVSKKILGRDRQLINKIKKHFETYGGISVVDFPEYEEVEKSIGWNEALDIAMEELKRKKLTKEEIIEEIQKEYQKNGKISSDTFKYSNQAKKIFGTWLNAVEESLGKGKVRGTKYTKEEIAEKIREQYNKDGKITRTLFKHSRYAVKYFGSWENAMIEVLGFSNRKEYFTKEEIIEKMREHYKNKGTLICKDFIYKRYATKIFGSWSAAMIASIGKTNINKSFSKEEIIEKMQEHYKKYGEINVKTFKYNVQATKLFGKWSEAMNASGISPNRCNLTKKEVIEAMKKEYKENGEIFQRTFKHIGHIKKYYKSWNHAIEEILGITNIRYYSKEEVIELIKKHYQEYGSIKTSDFRHVAQVVRCFGSWRNGMEEVLGFSNVTRYTKEEIIEFMKKHYKENGNIKSKDFKYKKQVTRYFGSWENAIKVIFGLRSNRFKYTKEEIILLMQESYKKNGKLSCSTFKDYGTAKRYFGSWEVAVTEAIGFYDKSKFSVQKFYSKESITEIILKFHKKNNRFPVDIEYGSEKLGLPGKTTINRHFGRLSEMKRVVKEELNRQNKIK